METVECVAGVSTPECGTDAGYRAGCRCIGCKHAHRHRSGEARRSEARERELRRDYGLTAQHLVAMVQAQGWRCAVCLKAFPARLIGKRVHVDHDHRSGRVRGVLCATCNLAIGKLGDTAAGVRRALVYLEAFERGYGRLG